MCSFSCFFFSFFCTEVEAAFCRSCSGEASGRFQRSESGLERSFDEHGVEATFLRFFVRVAMASELPAQLTGIDTEVQNIFKSLSTGFQKLDKTKDVSKQSKQLEELTAKMRDAKRLIKDFDREMKEEEPRKTPETNKLLNEKKQALIKELNSYVALRKTYTSSLGNKQELLDGGSFGGPAQNDNVRMASTMSNQELVQTGRKQMDETDQTIERSKKVVEDTINIGAETASTLKGQTDQLGRITNELDTIQFSIKKASQLVKEIGRQLATDRCIIFLLFLVVAGVIAVIVVKVVHSKNKSTSASPPPPGRRLLLSLLDVE